MTKVSEYRGSTVDELSDRLAKLKKEQFNLRFQRASGQLENTARVRVVRHDIARILTVLNQRGESTVIASPAPKKTKTKETKKAAAPKQAKKAPAKEDKKQPAKTSRAKKE